MFKGGLGYDLAQKIVDNIMKIVPYNINIMDRSGTIIASGNTLRINKQHMGAIKALEEQQPYYIYEDTELEKKGINVPFRYQDEIVGVIGVSGEPEKVEEIAHIVRVAAELMIEKQFYDNIAYTYETRSRDLLNEIMASPKELISLAVIERAKELDIDLNAERVVSVIEFKFYEHEWIDGFKSSLIKGEYIVKESKHDATVVFIRDQNLNRRIQLFLSTCPYIQTIYLGFPSKDLHASYQSVLSMIEIKEKLGLQESCVSIEDYILEETAFRSNYLDYFHDTYERFMRVSNHDELFETLNSYVQNGFDKNETCQQLFIHKNTFYYRMQRIEEITAMSTKNPKDVIILYMLLLKNSFIQRENASKK